MKAFLIAALVIVGSSAAHAEGTAGMLPANTRVTATTATVALEMACATNGRIASQGDGFLAYCKDHRWAAYQSSASPIISQNPDRELPMLLALGEDGRLRPQNYKVSSRYSGTESVLLDSPSAIVLKQGGREAIMQSSQKCLLDGVKNTGSANVACSN